MYDFWATLDDGSCCQDHCLTLDILSYDNGVGGGSSFTIRDLYSNELIVSEDLNLNVQQNIGICIPLDGCYTLDIDVPAFGSVSWQMSGTDQGTISGNSNSESFSLGGVDCPGCTDPDACNYHYFFDIDDGSCSYPGCLDLLACNYNPDAGCDDGSCLTSGCTNSQACNYNPDAACDDSSCSFCLCDQPGMDCPDNCIVVIEDAFLGGGMDASFTIYNLSTNEPVASGGTDQGGVDLYSFCLEDGCYIIYPNITPDWDPLYDVIYTIYFGGESIAYAYSDALGTDWYSDTFILGSINCEACIDLLACNYDPDALIDDGSCTYPGCNHPEAENYEPEAGCDDGSCIVVGCTYPSALNYSTEANDDDGSCVFDSPTCDADLNSDDTVNTSDLLLFLTAYGIDCPQ
jgi:hypothetical protein